MTPEKMGLNIFQKGAESAAADAALLIEQLRAEIERLQAEVKSLKADIASYIDDAVMWENRAEAAEVENKILRRMVELAVPRNHKAYIQLPDDEEKCDPDCRRCEYDRLVAQLKEMTK